MARLLTSFLLYLCLAAGADAASNSPQYPFGNALPAGSSVRSVEANQAADQPLQLTTLSDGELSRFPQSGNETEGNLLRFSDAPNLRAVLNVSLFLRGGVKLWLNQLALDPALLGRLDIYLHRQKIDFGAMGHSLDQQIIDAGAIGQSLDSQTIDPGAIGHRVDCDQSDIPGSTPPIDPTAVPEPSTASMLICGIGLLGGVLLRFRSGR